jgi:hypothetical protein
MLIIFILINFMFEKTSERNVGFEVLTEVVPNVAIFWDIAPSSLYVNRRFRGTYHLHLLGRKSAQPSSACWFLGRLIFNPEDVVIRSSETSDHIQTTRRYIREDGKILNERDVSRFV